MICSWAHNLPYFYSHAIPGPIALFTSCFNIMKFSRGQVFPITVHVWVGRIHNLAVIAASIGAILLSHASATPSWIKIGFYILLSLWFPTMILGWIHIRLGNVL